MRPDRLGPHPAIVVLAVVSLGAVGLAAAAGGTWLALRVVFWGAIGLAAYVTVGYPVLLAALLPWRARRLSAHGGTPSVALIIAAHDEEAVLDAKLRNSLAIDHPKALLSIVVVSDGSVDRTNAIATGFASEGVRLVALPQRCGKMTAINTAVSVVDAEIVVMSDANVMLETDALRHLVAPFADRCVGATFGDVILIGDRAALAWSEDLYYRYERWLQRAESRLGSTIGVDGGLFAVRRAIYAPPPADTILDDMLVPMEIVRQGSRVIFVPEARATEGGTATAAHELGRKSRVVAGAVQFLRGRASRVGLAQGQVLFALVSHKLLRWLTPLYGVAATAAAVGLAFEHPLYLGAALCAGGMAGLAALGAVPALRRWRIIGLCHYLCLVQLGAALGLIRGLAGWQGVRWRRFARTEARGA
jgi:cellulose synthase/poly-beta-1,6-N-acetylglucosamine synthase-like glycosyltransferase